MEWMKKNIALTAIIAFVVVMVIWAAYSGILKVPAISLPTRVTASAEEPVNLEPLESELEDQTEAIDALTGAVETQGEQIGDLAESVYNLVAVLKEPVAPAPQLEAEPTLCPEEPTDTTELVVVVEEETAGPIWSDPDAFDSRGTEYPMGDAEAWTYLQTWDGKNLDTVLHIAVAPGVVVVVREYVGTRFQVWNGPDLARWEEMRHECQVRDQLPKTPPLVVIETTADADIESLPANWSVQPFPG